MRTIIHEFAELCIRRLSAEQNELRVKLGKGGCRDHSEYSELCGQIEGLERSKAHIATVLSSVREDNDKEPGDE